MRRRRNLAGGRTIETHTKSNTVREAKYAVRSLTPRPASPPPELPTSPLSQASSPARTSEDATDVAPLRDSKIREGVVAIELTLSASGVVVSRNTSAPGSPPGVVFDDATAKAANESNIPEDERGTTSSAISMSNKAGDDVGSATVTACAHGMESGAPAVIEGDVAVGCRPSTSSLSSAPERPVPELLASQPSSPGREVAAAALPALRSTSPEAVKEKDDEVGRSQLTKRRSYPLPDQSVFARRESPVVQSPTIGSPNDSFYSATSSIEDTSPSRLTSAALSHSSDNEVEDERDVAIPELRPEYATPVKDGATSRARQRHTTHGAAKRSREPVLFYTPGRDKANSYYEEEADMR